MTFSVFYALFFWAAWIGTMMIILKVVPIGTELLTVFISAVLGVVMYFFISSIVTKCNRNLQDKKLDKDKTKSEIRKIFLNEQYLRKRYRYINLNKKEDIISSNIDKKDKIALLKIVHGYTPESAGQLIQAYESKR
jgi:mannitol-specific phosphotransferase system IIBC component